MVADQGGFVWGEGENQRDKQRLRGRGGGERLGLEGFVEDAFMSCAQIHQHEAFRSFEDSIRASE